MKHGWIGAAAAAALLLLPPREGLAQHTWQKPPPLRSRAALEKIIGPPAAPAERQPTRDLNVVLVWGHDNDTHDPAKKTHPAGCHEYRKFKDLWASLLSKVPRVRVDSAFYFPTARQWESADLVVFYLHLDFLADSHYVHIDKYQARGGAILAVHETAIQRPTGKAWAARIGMAWNEGVSKWGALPTPVRLDTASRHPILQGFGDTLGIVDEFYWNLAAGDSAGLDVLATSQGGPAGVSGAAPRPDQLDGKAWPLMWTYRKGPGKVFATTAGHNLFTFQDPYVRAILLRGAAWAMGQPFAPFKFLAAEGVQVIEDQPAALSASNAKKRTWAAGRPGFDAVGRRIGEGPRGGRELPPGLLRR